MRFEPLVDLPERPAPDALAFAFSGDRLLVRGDQVLTAAELDGLEPLALGYLDGRLCLAYQLPDDHDPGDGLELVALPLHIALELYPPVRFFKSWVPAMSVFPGVLRLLQWRTDR